ncbi:hypothetical protein [Actinoplanes sp. G11-F43]|uniref:hypothetical protein n=1 Tax=Actinoplanes sp. G11-F43 TaxID=3424130 RepID=UPI003D3518DB
MLLGDVGAGKTTFIQRLVSVEAPELFANAFTIYIDFGTSTTLGDLRRFVITESAQQLLLRHDIDIEDADFVEDVYRDELKLQDRRILGRLKDVDPVTYERERLRFLQRLVDDRAEHLTNSLNRLSSHRRRQIVVFLDNIDQRSDEDQEQVFLIASELAQNWPATVFVTLRPETFYASSRRGALSGYQPRVFTIAPPRTDTMLQRRVDFALHQLRETGRLGSFPAGVTVDSKSLIDFLEVLAENFQNNEKLLELIDNIAGGNMRLALRFVVDFLGSGHVNTAKILANHRERGRYVFSVHEFLRALMFGDSPYYDAESSPIANLLRITRPDGREHFLLPILLAQAQAQALGERGAAGGIRGGRRPAQLLPAAGIHLGSGRGCSRLRSRQPVAGRDTPVHAGGAEPLLPHHHGRVVHHEGAVGVFRLHRRRARRYAGRRRTVRKACRGRPRAGGPGRACRVLPALSGQTVGSNPGRDHLLAVAGEQRPAPGGHRPRRPAR